jgi:hypothetical protein
MSLAEVLPSVTTLSDEDKRDLLIFLSRDLTERPDLIVEGQVHSWWSPHEAHDAARALLAKLQQEAER